MPDAAIPSGDWKTISSLFLGSAFLAAFRGETIGQASLVGNLKEEGHVPLRQIVSEMVRNNAARS